MIKLLALDLDGTLLDSRGNVTPENREAIRSAEEAGVLVTIATGRRFRDALPVGLELEMNAPLITHNGALLKYASSLETVAVSLLSTDASLAVIKAGKEFGGNALVSADPRTKGSMLYDCVSADNVPLQRYIEWATRLHGDDAESAVIHVEDLEEAVPEHDVIHISFSGTCDRMDRMFSFLAAELDGSATILPTIYPHLDFTLIDILPTDASKGTGVEKLALLNGLTAENVMVCGDNFNDLEMLEYAGTPVVMGNAAAGLLERGEFFKTDSNDQSGVAAAINKFILN